MARKKKFANNFYERAAREWMAAKIHGGSKPYEFIADHLNEASWDWTSLSFAANDLECRMIDHFMLDCSLLTQLYIFYNRITPLMEAFNEEINRASDLNPTSNKEAEQQV